MEIIGFLIKAAIACFVGFWLLVIGGGALIVLWTFWPALIGIIVGAAIWINGADNVGVLFALGCFVGQGFWSFYLSKVYDEGSVGSSYGGPISMQGKKKHYDADGNPSGYSDSD